jgi:parallel beta-helix repeat protein/predicted outer membrane repeat protein
MQGGYRCSDFDGFTVTNGVAENGGGIYCNYTFATVANCVVTNNKAAKSGAGIYSLYGAPIIQNNQISANIVTSDSGSGGAICADGYAFPTLWSNTIIGNSAAMGAGINCNGSFPWIISNTVVGNSSTDGGAIYASGSTSAIENNILAFNSSGLFSQGGRLIEGSNCVYGNTKYDYSGHPLTRKLDRGVARASKVVGNDSEQLSHAVPSAFRPVVNSTASFSAAMRLPGSALPCQAISKAVP